MPNSPAEPGARGFSFFGRGRQAPAASPLGVNAGQVLGDFRLVRSLGQGGMGQVWEAQQLSLGRPVALKLVRPDRVSEKTLALFSREARAGGRLQHPNLVAVHAHGADGGIAWIAMELVEGAWTLRDFLDEAAKESEVPAGYYRDAARFVAAVADGMQAAHAAGVIHRDLKPQNILIDPQDRPKVTDFGLAKLIDESALSVSGEVAGTYWYMSPEQVAAKRIGLDHRTDVFSLGVVLYELLSHRRPFEGDTSRQVAEQIVTHDPPELRTVRSRIPRDLAVITAKCLEKARDRRFGTMAELAADLRRYLNNEPILAQPPSRLVKVGLWMRRNPTKSVAGGVAVVAFGIISALLAENVKARAELTESNSSLEEQTRVAQEEAARAERAADAERIAKQAAQEQAERAERAAEAERLAAAAAERSAAAEKRRADEVLRLSAIQNYEDLLAEADKLWPPYPDQIPAYERWLSEAQALVDELPEHYRKRDELRALALPQTEEEREADRRSHPEFPRLAELEAALAAAREAATSPVEGSEPESDDAKKARAAAEEQLLKLETDLAALTERLAERRDWHFPPEEENARWWNGNLTKLIEALEGLEDPKTGLLSSAPDAVSEEHGWSVARRLEFAQSIADRSVTGPDAQRLWSEAIAAIGASPKYDGLTLTPQMGLLPIGADPDSGLWEFAHLATGEAPLRDEAGRIVRTESMGVVLVLIPGGTFWMGAQRIDPDGQNYDPDARPNEAPVHESTLSAYFLSKYEATQGQWRRIAGRNPAFYKQNSLAPTLLHPVEQLSWEDAMRWLPRVGLSLPSEAQWEYGARGGTTWPRWIGETTESLLAGKVNIVDRTFVRAGGPTGQATEMPTLDDGSAVHGEVGFKPANNFGLHEVLGNVWEWCLDSYRFYPHTLQNDPLINLRGSSSHITRGGSFFEIASGARSAIRNATTPAARSNNIGLRPLQSISP